MYSREQIAKIYDRRRQGLYDDQQFARLEADIIRAAREGRVADPVTDINGK
jgi:hypothetical protein